MQEISFSIPVSGIIRISEDTITIVVNKAETAVHFEPTVRKPGRVSLGRGQTLFDIVLSTARKVAADIGSFSGADLYHEALEKYPDLKRGSWTSHVIACAPNHSSYKHYGARRNYFQYTGNGRYRLKPEYQSAALSGDDESSGSKSVRPAERM